MAFVGIKKTSLPVVSFGRQSTGPQASISENGQLRLNKLLYEAIGSPTKVLLAFDEASRALQIVNTKDKLPKGWTAEDLLPVSVGKKSKANGASVSLAAVLRLEHIGYDFKKSGNQPFAGDKLVVNAEKSMFTITVPKGALEARPKQQRTKKADKAAAGTQAQSAGAADALDLGL